MTEQTPEPTTNQSNISKKTASMIGVAILVVIGFVMSMQSVSLMTGTGSIWMGVAVVAIGTAAAFFLPVDKWVRIVASVVLALAVANVIYVEYQMSEKRSELSQIFGD